ncbi:hypothetical protein [Sulfuriroseicoccus oceanibius]|uniref:Uncharacterized protein n=1 Tax=Sulfuriroseicoccus oceanibius TaxID=2707525 RepID=A0A6B3LCW4_9BACT|nr:hypothetical protein [Sulfuriroseicoccus oceanibius]QQL45811.1 hypothetical protein G3M56_004300 [Sulfuriroseicoccus oceanibius]
MADEMTRREWMKKAACSVAGVVALSSCGTLIYPERRGRTGGRIDPEVVIMDGLLCVLFVLPGVIAFAVDFATGAIYTNEYAGVKQHPVPGRSEEDYNRVVAEATGREIALSDQSLRVSTLEGVLTAEALEQEVRGDVLRPRLVKDDAGRILRCERSSV